MLLVHHGLLVPFLQIDTGQIRFLENRRADALQIVRVAVMCQLEDLVALADDTAVALGALVPNAQPIGASLADPLASVDETVQCQKGSPALASDERAKICGVFRVVF